MNEGRGGGGAFPLDSGLNAYAEMPAPAAPEPTPAAPTPPPMVVAALPIASSATPPAPARMLPEVATVRPPPAPPEPTPAPLVIPGDDTNDPGPASVAAASAARWADFGLLGLLAAGGVFVWRTRRTTTPTETIA